MTRFEELQRKQMFLFKAYSYAYRENNKDLMDLWNNKLKTLQKHIEKITVEKAKSNYKKRYNHICKSVGIIIKNNKVYNIENGKIITWGELIEYWKGGN